ncbi:RNA-directed DNA polymerase, eukaryota [Tanacetum coccineum]
MEASRRNFFNGVNNSDRKMSLIRWKKILASKKNGGLGVSSLFALRYMVVRGAMISLITPLEGLHDLISFENSRTSLIQVRYTSLISSFKRPPCGGIEEEMWLLGDIISSVVLSYSSDRWIWRLDSLGDFSVKSVRRYIDDSFLPKEEVPTRWINSIPIKVNIFAWKVCLDKLLTRLNISLHGLDIPLTLCPICHVVVESTDHLLFSCDMARQLMRKVARWWEVEFHDAHSYGDLLIWFRNLRFSKRLKDVFEGVCYVLWPLGENKDAASLNIGKNKENDVG